MSFGDMLVENIQVQPSVYFVIPNEPPPKNSTFF